MNLRRSILSIAAGVVLALASMAATAATSAATVNWVLPTTGCTVAVTPCDNTPLTGAQALTGVDIYASTSVIPDNSVMAPTVSLAAGVTTTTVTLTVLNGDTLHFRLKVRNQFGASDFTTDATKVVTLPVKPGVATSVTITLTIT